MSAAQSPHNVLVDFLAACGVNAVVAEIPQNRFDERPVAAPPPPEPKRMLPAAAPPVETHETAPSGTEREAPVMAAREAARAAPSLEALREALAAFDGCALKATARSTCVGEGPAGAPLMLVGEAPGEEEDAVGRPFVGRSGRLLEKMLAAIGLSREAVYITNILPWRPPGNRTPGTIEAATCEVFVRREIALVRPRILVALGGAAAKTLLDPASGITRQRGRWQSFPLDDGGTVEAMATFHPAYLLRTPGAKAMAWRDLLSLAERLDR